MRHIKDTFETHKRSFISTFSIHMTVPLNKCHNFFRIYFRNICVGLEGVIAQQCLLAMLEKWKRSVNNRKMLHGLLADLSKDFDCLDYELLIAKLYAYGFSLIAFKLVHNYLSKRKQQPKINSSYSSWLEIIFGVLPGSILEITIAQYFLLDFL